MNIQKARQNLSNAVKSGALIGGETLKINNLHPLMVNVIIAEVGHLYDKILVFNRDTGGYVIVKSR